MKKKLKIFAASFLLTTIPVGLASCGGGDDGSKSSEPDQQSTQQTTQQTSQQSSPSEPTREIIAPRFDGMTISETSPLQKASSLAMEESSYRAEVKRLGDEEPTDESGEEPAGDPEEEPGEGQIGDPEGEKEEDPGEGQQGEPGENPEGDPAEDPEGEPGEGQEGDPTGDPTEDPTEEPGEGPKEGPGEEPGPGPHPGEEPGPHPGEDDPKPHPGPIDVPKDNMPTLPENADIEENLLPSISVSEEANITPFYAEVNQDVFISVRIVNPESYAILRFTLNGVVYQSYQFEDGSNSELLVLKVSSGSVAGIKEFTIDQIKYVSDFDNQIRDVIIDGNQTVKLSVAYDKDPSAVIDNESQNYSSYTGSVNVSDPYGLVDYGAQNCKLYFYDGQEIMKEIPLQKGINTFTVDGLELGKNYQYIVVANYDRLDETGFSTHLLLKRDVNTGTFCKITNVVPSHESVSFDYRVLNTMATITGAYLFQDGEAIQELDPENDAKQFDGLLSNTKYQIRVYYGFTLFDKDYVYYDAFDFTTKAHAVPTLNATFKVYESSVEYNVHVDDDEGLINLKNIKLYTQSGTFIASASYEDHVIEGLNRNTNYYLRFLYTYDLNDGNGEVEAEKVVAFSTTKAIPQVEIRPYRSTASALGFDLLVTDPNVVGQLNSIRLYDEGGMFITQLNNLSLREFTGLKANTKYVIQVGYIYDLNDGDGSQIITFTQEMSTAKVKPTVDFTATPDTDGIQIESNVIDNDGAGEITAINVIDNGVSKTIEPGAAVYVPDLLSDHDYQIEFVYAYNLQDLTGQHEETVTKRVHTLAKTAPQINVSGKNATYTSFDLSVRAYDPSQIAKINGVKVSLGTLEIASVENLEDLSFEGLYSNSRYTVTVSYEYDLNDGSGLQRKEAVSYVSTLKRDDVSIQYQNMTAGETSIDFDLKFIDKDNLITLKGIELYDEDEQLVEALEDLTVRRFENLKEESFYTIKTNYEFDLGDGKGVQQDSAIILYGTSGAKIFISSLSVLNNENPSVGDEVQVLVKLDNPHNLEVTGVFISGIYCPVLNNSSDKSDVIVKFVPDSQGGYYTVTVTGYEFVTSGVTLQESLTSEYEEDILIMGELKVVDYLAVSNTYYENYTTTPMRILEINNPTGYEVTKLTFLSGFWSGDNNTYESANFKMIDANHIAIFEQGISDGGVYDLVLTGITYGLEGVERNLRIDYLHSVQGYYNQVIHIKDVNGLLALGTTAVNGYNNQTPNLYILDSDIDCDGIAWEGLVAAGVFDGNGHTIKNIRTVYNDENNQTQYYGLFKSFNGIIHDLTVENIYFSVTTKGTVYAAGIAAANARVYDSAVKNSTFDIHNEGGQGRVVGVSITDGTGYGTAPRLSTNNYVEDLVIKTNINSVALVTDRNTYYSRIDGAMDGREYVSLDAGGLGSIAVGNSYIEKEDGTRKYYLYLNDYNESGLIYINRKLENVVYHIHTNCEAVEDFDQEGYAVNAINVTREGYSVAWYDNPDFDGEPIAFPYVSTDKTDLYAAWKRVVLADPSFTYGETSIWDEANQTSVQGYYIRSFNLEDKFQDRTLVIGGYYKGLPVFGVGYEAMRELRMTEDGYEDWDINQQMAPHITVYYLDTVRFNNFSENIPAKATYLCTKDSYFGFSYYWFEDGTRSQLYVPVEYEEFYNNRFFKYEEQKARTYTANDNPYNALDNLAPTDEENAKIKASVSDANNLLESIKFDKEDLPYTIEEGNLQDVRYMEYNGTRFALIGKNVYVGVKEITSDDTFRYIVYENGEVVIDSLLNPNLQSIDLTKLDYKVTEIAGGVFRNSKVRNIVLNEGLTSIGDYAFAFSPLTSVTFPSTLQSIGQYAFYECESLSKVVSNDGITRIRQGAFQYCYSLREVVFSNKLKHVEASAFYGCPIGNVILPNSVQSLGEQSFYSWNTMTVFVPASVKTINRAFNYNSYDCTIYTSVSVKPNAWIFSYNEMDDEVRLNIFYDIKEVKENETFRYLVTNEGEVIVSKLLSGNATNVDLTFEEGPVVQIANYAFSEDSNLKYIVLPATVINVAANSFNGNTQILSKANAMGSAWDETVASRTVFGIKDVVVGEDFVYALDGDGYASIIALSKEFTKDTVDFNLGEGIKVIGIGAWLFSSNTYIRTVNLPDTLQSIGSYAFAFCTNLKQINLPDSLEEMGESALRNTGIREVVIPTGIKEIPAYAFADCFDLAKVTLPEGLLAIGEYAFAWTNNLSQIEIPESVVIVEQNALSIRNGGTIIHHDGERVPQGWNTNFFEQNRNIRVIYEDDKNYTFLVIDANFDSSINTIYEGEIATAPNIGLYDDAYIEGWYLDPEFKSEVTFPYTGEGHISRLYAKVRKTIWAYYYVPEYGYTTNFASGYGPLTVSEPGYTKNGYYVEWYLDSALTKQVGFPLVISENTTFYPKLVAIEYFEVDGFTYYLDASGDKILASYDGEEEYVDLGEIEALEGLAGIGTSAFKGNRSIKSVVIPEGVSSISAYAFQDCTNLVSVTLPESLFMIGASAFQNCRQLASIELPESLFFIGASAFQNCNLLREIVIPSNIASIENYTFYNTGLRKVTLPEGLVAIGSNAFSNCGYLTTVALPSTLTKIGSYAFAWSGIRMIEVPKSVTMVEYCGLRIANNGIIVTHETKRDPAGWNENYRGQNDGDYYNCNVVYEDGKSHILLVIDGNFDYSSVKIDYSGEITKAPTINLYDNNVIAGWYTDAEFTQEATFPYATSDHLTFLYAKVDKYVEAYAYNLGTIANGYNQLVVQEPNYTRSDSYVGSWYLDSALTQEVTFPYTITISTTLYPKWVDIEIIEDGDFEYYEDRHGNKVLTKYNGEEQVVDLNVLEDLVSISSDAFKNNRDLVKVIIPETVTSIGSCAFYNCSNLVSADLPKGLTYLGTQAFYYCSSLQEIVVPNGITRIESHTFYNSGLRKITLPEGLLSIADCGIANCSYLTAIELPSTLTRIEYGGLGWTAIRYVELPASVTYVGDYGLYIDSGVGVIVTHEAKKNPSAWSENWYGQNYETSIKVIYEDGKKHTFLMIDAGYDSSTQTEYVGEIAAAPSVNLYGNAKLEGWYLDPEFTQEATFPYTGGEHINYLYAKVSKYVEAYAYNLGTIGGDYNQFTFQEPIYTRSDSYVGGWYLDSALTQEVTFPCTINVSTTFYPKWVNVEYETQGDFTYYVDRYGNKVLTKYEGEEQVVDLTVLEDLVAISSEAFKNNHEIVRVIIPETVTSIGTSAFYNCNKLASIELPKGLTYIGSEAFARCGELREIVIPEGITTIECNTFYNSGLRKVTLPEGLLTIRSEAFRCCYSLNEINLPSTLTRIEYGSLGWTDIRFIEVPASVTYVGDYGLFINTSLGVIVTHEAKRNPAGWSENWYGQEGDINIKVIYEDGKKYTFLKIDGDYDSSNQTEYVGEITDVPNISLYGRSRIEGWYLDPEFKVEATFPYSASEHISFLYAKVAKYVTAYYYSETGDTIYLNEGYGPLTIDEPDYTKKGYFVDWYADVAFTKPVTFPTKINVDTTFYPKFTEIEIIEDGDFHYYEDRDGNVVLESYSGKDEVVDLTGIEGLSVIGASAFRANNNIKEVIFPDTVTTIGAYAFNGCYGLDKVTLPEGLLSIGAYAFAETGLDFIEVPASVTFVGNYGLRIAYDGVVVIHQETTYPETWDANYCGTYEGMMYPIHIVIDDDLAYIFLRAEDSSFEMGTETEYYELLTGAPQVSLLNQDKVIGWYLDPELTGPVSYPYAPEAHYSFLYAKVDKHIQVYAEGNLLGEGYGTVVIDEEPSYVRAEQYVAGWYLDVMLTQEVSFPFEAKENTVLYAKWADIVYIEDGVYTYFEDKHGNKTLTGYDGNAETVDLSEIENLVAIGENVFQNNRDIVKVIVPEGVKSIGSRAFANCNFLVEAVLPSTLESIGYEAFYYCRKLAKADLPASLETIGYSAFYYCSTLKEAVIPSGVKQVENNTFYNCYNLSKLTLNEGLVVIGYGAFGSCSSLTAVSLPSTLERIEDSAFSWTGIRLIEVPESVEYVGSYALRINSYGVIVTHETRNSPSAWSDNYYGQSDSENYIKVIYEDGNVHTVLVVDGSYDSSTKIDYAGKIDSKPSINLNNSNRIAGWYLDPDFVNEVTFPYDPSEHLNFLYAKIEKWVEVYGNNYGTIANGYDQVTIETMPSAISDNRYIVGWFYDSSLTMPVSFPFVATSYTTIYPKWVNIEYVTQGDFTYYVDVNGGKVVTGYSGNARVVDLSEIEGLVAIANGAFFNKSMVEVIIPEGVVSIGYQAFGSCYSLRKVTFPSTLREIGGNAFCDINRLTDYELPEGLVSIGSYAFNYTGAGVVVIPSTVTRIGERGVYGRNIIVNASSVEDIPTGWNADYYGNYGTVYYNDGSNYVALVVGESFNETPKLVYKDVVAEAPSLNLSGAKIVGWYLDPEFTKPASFPFVAEESISYLYAKTSKYLSISYVTGTSTTWQYGYSPLVLSEPAAEKNGYYLEGWYTDQAFTQKVAFPYVATSSVSFYPKWVAIVEKEDAAHSFYYYEKGDGIVISQYYGTESVVDLSDIDNLVGIGDRAFAENEAITKVILPEGVTFIGNSGFYQCRALQEIVLPSTLTSIGSASFQWCSSLSEITMPKGLVSIGNSAFSGCSGLQQVSLPNSLMTIGDYAFESCGNMVLGENGLSSSLTYVGSYAFNTCRGLTSIVIPEGVTTIKSGAFRYCTNLTSVVLPEGLLSIENEAFERCTNLREVQLPSTLTTIGDRAFADDPIRILIVPDSVSQVGYDAFAIGQNNVVIHNGNAEIPDGWASDCFGNGSSRPTVVYGQTRRYIVLVADNLYIKGAYLNNVSQTTLQSTGLTWYTTPDFEEGSEIQFDQEGYYRASEEHITYIYGKAA